MTPVWTFVFSAGDGVFAVNGETIVIAGFEENAPPYLAYKLVPSSIDRSLLGFKVRRQMLTESVQSIMIGSDGVADLIGAAEKPLPGKEEPIGPLAQFWTKESFVTNPDAIRRRLALVNLETVDRSGEVPRIKPGPLSDDTTVVVIKRMKEEVHHA